MKNNVNINEGLESLERILLMMKYDNKKTLSENYAVLKEQPDSKFDTPYTKELMRKYEKPATLEDVPHEVLQWGAAITGVAGFAFPPLLFVSMGLEALDGFKYLQEGDNYMAGLTFALMLIPGSELLPKGVIRKPIQVVSKEIMGVMKSAGRWSDDLLKKMSPEASKLVKWIAKNFDNIYKIGKEKIIKAKNVFKEAYDKVKDMGVMGKILHKFFTVLKKLGKFVGKIFTNGIVPAGGIMWTWDKLYNWLSSKTNSELEEYGRSGEKAFDEFINSEEGNEEESKSGKSDGDTKITSSDKVNNKTTKKWIPSPKIDDVSSGKSYIRLGMYGDSVKTIQNNLKNKGYDITIDSKYGNETKNIVTQFQKDNNIKIDGIVGLETLNKLNQ